MHINTGHTIYGRQAHSPELIESLEQIAREDGDVYYNGIAITRRGEVRWNTGEFFPSSTEVFEVFEVFGQLFTTLIEAIDYIDERIGIVLPLV